MALSVMSLGLPWCSSVIGRVLALSVMSLLVFIVSDYIGVSTLLYPFVRNVLEYDIVEPVFFLFLSIFCIWTFLAVYED